MQQFIYYHLDGNINSMAEIKVIKADILGFMMQREIITPHDLVEHFAYTLSYARKRLTLLKKQGLVENLGDIPLTYRGQWILTEKGYSRALFYHEKGRRSKEWCYYCVI